MKERDEVQRLVLEEYQRLRRQNPHELDGMKLLSLAKKYVSAQLLADWYITQSDYKLGAFNEK